MLKRIFRYLLLLLINVYQTAISPLFPSCCRFRPTCSEYAKEAIEKFGIVDGLKLSFKRICKCRPKSSFGYDPVPDKL